MSLFTHRYKRLKFEEKVPFIEHLEELRFRLLIILCSIGIGFFISYSFQDTIILILKRPLPPAYSQLTVLSPTEAFFIVLKLSFFSGIIISTPVIFYEVWCFVAPGLFLNEKRFIFPIVSYASLLFFIGVLFSYVIVLPLGLKFLLGYSTKFGVPSLTVSNYISFSVTFMLVFGLIFQLPLVLIFLIKIEFITLNQLKRFRRYNILLSFILGAILTPPDVFTQTMVAIPLIILYEISILISSFLKIGRTATYQKEGEKVNE